MTQDHADRIDTLETVVHGHSERLLLMEGLMQVLVDTQAQLAETQARLTETQARQTALLEELRRDTAQNQRIWIALCQHFGLDVTDILGQ